MTSQPLSRDQNGTHKESAKDILKEAEEMLYMRFSGSTLVGGNDARAKMGELHIQHVIYQARFHKYPT
jgi:hypothetical protein